MGEERREWPRLAADPEALGESYDVVITGSGYGGAITAARLGFASHRAGRKLRIAVLERGSEHPTGTGPESQRELRGELRSRWNPLGFYEVLRFGTIDVLKGNALGGTSLNNFNVAIVPDRRVFEESWPEAIREEVADGPSEVGALAAYYERAKRMLGANPWRDGQGLKKAAVMDELAERAGSVGETLDLVVSTEDRVSRYGVERRRCVNCGDCAMICNHGAKNTLMTNYLPMARHFGVELFDRVEVDRIAPGDGGWELRCRQRSGKRGRKTAERVIAARRVVLGAGSLGSTAILLRSAADGLPLSPRLGKSFSGNGDNFGFAYNTDRKIEAVGYGTDTGPRSEQSAGPSITSMIRFGTGQPDLRKRFAVQDISTPRALADTLRVGFLAMATPRRRGWSDEKAARWRADRRRADRRRGRDGGALDNTIGFLLMTHDASDGQIVLGRRGEPRVEWPGAALERIYSEIDEVMAGAVEGIGGTYLKNPRWSTRLLGNHLITAHPLGGCAVADTVDYGVVDHAGRVFNPGGGVHEGLHVVDGAVIPRALSVNPLLTISMFAERAAEHMRADLGLPAYDPDLEGDDR